MVQEGFKIKKTRRKRELRESFGIIGSFIRLVMTLIKFMLFLAIIGGVGYGIFTMVKSDKLDDLKDRVRDRLG